MPMFPQNLGLKFQQVVGSSPHAVAVLCDGQATIFRQTVSTLAYGAGRKERPDCLPRT
jgi:hypothetical protein